MSLKRKSQPIEEEDHSESSDLEVVDVEDSDREDELPPLKKKKKIQHPSSITVTTKQQADFRRAQQQLSNYRKKSMQITRGGKGTKGMVATTSVVEFDFDELDVCDMQDNARQTITKKKFFPRGMIGTIVRAERIDFSKDKKKDRAEIVIDVDFIYDLQEAGMKRTVGAEEIDYTQASIRLHLPKRYQDQLEGLVDLGLLYGGLILCPEHDDSKWKDKKDEDKSSIPLIMLFKSKKALEKFGLTSETYPSAEEFIEEGHKVLTGVEGEGEEGYEAEGVFKILFDYFKHQSERFYAKESHRSNAL